MPAYGPHMSDCCCGGKRRPEEAEPGREACCGRQAPPPAPGDCCHAAAAAAEDACCSHGAGAAEDACCSHGAGAAGGHAAGAAAAGAGACCGVRGRIDWLLWGSLGVVAAGCAVHWWAGAAAAPWLAAFGHAVFALMGKAWWGILAGIVAVAVVNRLPRELVTGLLGRGGSFAGILRAAVAGILLDLCNHGILMVAMQLCRKGASPGQTFAFLIASPWNSLSLTLILLALIGWQWTLAFIGLSMVVGVATGWLADRLVAAGRLPANPHRRELPDDFRFLPAWREAAANLRPGAANLRRMAIDGLSESRMVLRWIFFGLVLAAAIRAFVPDGLFQHYFGPSLAGLLLTLLATSVIEVCSEGSSPVAADLLTRAGAPGNAFTFLMAGAATDYTEVLVLRQTTRSWLLTLALPLLATPQVLVLGWVLNQL